MTCPICGSREVRVRARPDPWTFLQCGRCGVLFVDPMPTGPAVAGADEHYTDVYYGASEPRPDEPDWDRAARRVARARVSRITATLGRRGRFLDVGAGTGHLLAAAAEAGWEVQGVEVSARAAAHAAATHGVPVTVGTVQQAAFPDGSFDAATLVHVFEHVPDPLALLGELHRIMAPSAVLNVAVPNAAALIHGAYNLVHRVRGRYGRDRYSCSLFPPDHLYAFDEAALRGALARGGFEVLALTITGKGDPEHYPVVRWRGAGRAAPIEAVLHRVGRAIGRGSIIDCIARRI